MPMKRIFRTAHRPAKRAAGYALIGLGSVLAITPLPAGILLAGVGAAILIPADSGFRRWVRERRRSSKWLDGTLNRIGHAAPGSLGRYLIR
ncbi:hypothetical protein [Maricaulis sp.]|uniref:hypothetical protein n=1 Tax=Maricaulis sp. TaxID=1486257 RepID=UPI001B187D9E|nr:hypothetical protein [Maricaulis sp.]MBO6764479.1 hypothetical protein [Maricaulis sp.]